VRRLWERFLGVRSGEPPLEERIYVEGVPRRLVAEALARQRALAEQRLRRTAPMKNERAFEEGRRCACIEAAKELGLDDEVTERVWELRKR
jgi:hypothetical protein